MKFHDVSSELTISLEVTSGSIVAAVFALLHPLKEAAIMSRAITAMSFFLFVYFMENPPDDRPWRYYRHGLVC